LLEKILTIKDIMTDYEHLEDLVGSIESIEPYGIEPDFSSLGIEPAEVLGFETEVELENAIKLLTMDVKHSHFYLINIKRYIDIQN